MGKTAYDLFRHEAGGTRWQRIPPTEKRGRVHTSTVTVAVLPLVQANQLRIDPKDIDLQFTRGSGAGGQHRNVTASAVQLTHRPTGIRVRIENERSQHANRETAIEILRSRLVEQQQAKQQNQRNRKRQQQVGSGMRGDKIRTVQTRRDLVVDHRTGKRCSYKRYQRGELRLLR